MADAYLVSVLALGTSVAALVTTAALGTYTLYKNFFEKARLSIFPGDRMSIVRGPEGARRIHLSCVLVNNGAKHGTLQHLEARITNPEGQAHRYLWNELVGLVPGTTYVQSAGFQQPIPVPAKDSRPLVAQLEAVNPNAPAHWIAGRYEVRVRGWINQRDRPSGANAEAIFHINISAAQASEFSAGQAEYNFDDIPIEEWRASPS